jgi:hypothetical protein
MSNRTHARIYVSEVAVERNGTQFLVEPGGRGVFRYKVDRDVRIPTWVGQTISRGEYAYVLVSFDHTGTVRRVVKA